MANPIKKTQLDKMRKHLRLQQPLYAVRQGDMDQPMVRDSEAIQEWTPVGHKAHGPGILYKPMYNRNQAAYQLSHMKAQANLQDNPIDVSNAVKVEDVDRTGLRIAGLITALAGLGGMAYGAASRNGAVGIGGALATIAGALMGSAQDYTHANINLNKLDRAVDKRYDKQTKLMVDNTKSALRHIKVPVAKLPSQSQFETLQRTHKIKNRLRGRIAFNALIQAANATNMQPQTLFQALGLS